MISGSSSSSGIAPSTSGSVVSVLSVGAIESVQSGRRAIAYLDSLDNEAQIIP